MDGLKSHKDLKIGDKIMDLAQKIVMAIEKDLRDRRGLRQEFERIDKDIQDEIRSEWAKLVREEIEKIGNMED